MDMLSKDALSYSVCYVDTDATAERIVFIDDKIENVEAAKAMGIDAILFESEPQVKAELMRRGVLE